MICMGALTDCQRLLQDSGSPAQLALSSSLAWRPPSSDVYGRVAVIRLGGASASHVWGCAVISQWFVWEGSQQGTLAGRRSGAAICLGPAPATGSHLYGRRAVI